VCRQYDPCAKCVGIIRICLQRCKETSHTQNWVFRSAATVSPIKSALATSTAEGQESHGFSCCLRLAHSRPRPRSCRGSGDERRRIVERLAARHPVENHGSGCHVATGSGPDGAGLLSVYTIQDAVEGPPVGPHLPNRTSLPVQLRSSGLSELPRCRPCAHASRSLASGRAAPAALYRKQGNDSGSYVRTTRAFR
jgi:hypothetical protein